MKKLIYSIILIILTGTILHGTFFYSTKSIVHGDNSVNPKATTYFIHANVISTLYIHNLQKIPFINYDSFLIKPLISLTNYFFNKGEKHLEENNAENVVWWYLTYAKIYNINKESNKLNTISVFPKEKKANLDNRFKMSNYIIKLGNEDVKGLDFGKYKSSAMHSLFAIHFSHFDINKHYDGTTYREKIIKFGNDTKIYDIRLKTYYAYKKFIEKDNFINRYKFANKNLCSAIPYLLSYQYYKNDKKIQCNDSLLANDFYKCLKEDDGLIANNKKLINLIQEQCK